MNKLLSITLLLFVLATLAPKSEAFSMVSASDVDQESSHCANMKKEEASTQEVTCCDDCECSFIVFPSMTIILSSDFKGQTVQGNNAIFYSSGYLQLQSNQLFKPPKIS